MAFSSGKQLVEINRITTAFNEKKYEEVVRDIDDIYGRLSYHNGNRIKQFIAESYYELKQYPSAIIWFKRTGKSQVGIALCYEQMGRYDLALTIYEPLVMEFPSGEVLFFAGRCMLKLNRNTLLADAHLRRAIPMLTIAWQLEEAMTLTATATATPVLPSSSSSSSSSSSVDEPFSKKRKHEVITIDGDVTPSTSSSSMTDVKTHITEMGDRVIKTLQAKLVLHETHQCIACLDRARSVVFDPCRHAVYCKECSLKATINEQCPVCREPIKKKDKIILA